MKFLDKIKEIGAKIKVFAIKVFNYFKNNKKASLIAGISAAAVIVILVVIFGFVKPQWDYSHKEVGDTGYTQSQIDEIADWWQNEAIVENEGDTPLDK